MGTTWQGERLRAARDETGLSQSKFAARIGAHFTSISDWERNANQPSGRHLASICELTGKLPAFFFGGDVDGDESVNALARSIRDTIRHELERNEA